MSLTTISLVLSAAAIALNLWVLWHKRRHELKAPGAWGEDWKAEAGVYTLWKLLRIKVLSGGYGKHNAYYVTEYGALLAVDAVDFYLAHFAGMNDFWELVADGVGGGSCGAAVSLEQIDLGDGKRDFTYVDNGRIRAFVDGIVPGSLIDSHLCARATSEDFKNAVINAQAEARKRYNSRYIDVFNRGIKD